MNPVIRNCLFLLAISHCLLGTCVFVGCGSTNDDPQSKKDRAKLPLGGTISPPRKETQKWGDLDVVLSGEKLSAATDVFVFLHGMAGDADDMMLFRRELKTTSTTCFVFPNGPFSARNGGRAWMTKAGDFEVSRGHILALLQHVKNENPRARIILGGFSQGAILSSNLISEEPQLLSGVVLLAPAGQLRHEPKDSATKPLIFLGHGKYDRALPFEGSERLREKLVSLNYDVDWFPFDGGHKFPPSLAPRLNEFLHRVQQSE